MDNVENTSKAVKLCDELIQAAYDADICGPGDLAQRVRKIQAAIGSSPHGNAVVMHEALDRITRMTDTNPGHLKPIAILTQIGEVAEAAIAEPQRNCDVGTAEEQQERFREFCRRHEAAGECGIGKTHAKCPCWQEPKNPDCSLWWAQMPYEGKGDQK